jgi:hypothetical protein
MNISLLKCFLGFHECEDTGIRRMYGFVKIGKCIHCGKRIELMEPLVKKVT